jgi:1,4-alpha-glucan branching enzyme
VSLVWSDDGYPASPAYRDYHHHTVHHHNPWDNAGGAYDHERALGQARAHAADFVSRTLARLREANETAASRAALPAGGLVVCALDTELLGHWWYEGIEWLRAVADECSTQGLELLHLDDALERHEPVAAAHREERPTQASTWGSDGDLSTWSGPAVADMAFAMRAAELRVLATERVGEAAVRELLALQASDWPFMISRGLTVPYAHERFEGHRLALERALAAGRDADTAGLRNLAVDADPASLRMPL